MNYTNRHHIPDHICRWLAADDYDYDPAVISATTLLGPARAWALKRRHAEDLSCDYSDLFALRYGTAIHDSLEKVGVYAEGDFREKRFYAEIMGFRISGKPDALIGGVLRDNKSTSVWKLVRREFDDYIKQLSIYRWLLMRNGIAAADFAFIDFFFTDWKKSDALRGGGYPPIRYQEQRLELMTPEATQRFIASRLEEFAFAEQVLPLCSDEELWRREASWAVYKQPGQKRAFRVFATEAEAGKAAEEIGGVVEFRPGKAKRCEYCSAAPFCEQFLELKQKGEVDVD